MDRVYELAEATNFALLLTTLLKTVEEYSNADEDSRSLAASEVVAALKEAPATDLPEEAWT